MCKENLIEEQVGIFKENVFEIIEDRVNDKKFRFNGKVYTVLLKKCCYEIDGYRTEYAGDHHLLINSRYGKRHSIRTIHKLIKKDIPITKEEITDEDYRIIDDTFRGIEELFYKVQDKDLDGMEELEQYQLINNKLENIKEKMMLGVKENMEELIEEYEYLTTQMTFLESLYYFKEGLNLGLTLK